MQACHFLLQIYKSREELGKEQKLGPSKALANPPSADGLQDEKAEPSSSIPCTKAKESDEDLQDTQVSIVKVSKVGVIRGTNAKERICTTQVKSSSLLLESCTMVTKSGDEFHPKVHVMSENGNVQECAKEDVKATQQREEENFVELPVTPTQVVQDKVVKAVQKTKDLPLPEDKDFSRDRDLKRKFDSGGDYDKSSTKVSKFCWSQDVAVQNPGITSKLPSTGEKKLRLPSNREQKFYLISQLLGVVYIIVVVLSWASKRVLAVMQEKQEVGLCCNIKGDEFNHTLLLI